MKTGQPERERKTEQRPIVLSSNYSLTISNFCSDGKTYSYIASAGQIDPCDRAEDLQLARDIYTTIVRARRILRGGGKAVKQLPLLEENRDNLTRAFLAYISVNYTNKDIMKLLAERFHFKIKYLSEIICRETGLSPAEHILRLRLREAEHLLATTGMRISDIADHVGYDSASGFSKAYRKYYNKAPGSARKRGRKSTP